jgi:hypothetical protein
MFGSLPSVSLDTIRCSEDRTRPKRRIIIEAQAKSDGLRLLRAIDTIQGHG